MFALDFLGLPSNPISKSTGCSSLLFQKTRFSQFPFSVDKSVKNHEGSVILHSFEASKSTALVELVLTEETKFLCQRQRIFIMTKVIVRISTYPPPPLVSPTPL